MTSGLSRWLKYAKNRESRFVLTQTSITGTGGLEDLFLGEGSLEVGVEVG